MTKPKKNHYLFLSLVFAVCACGGGGGRSQPDAGRPDVGSVGGLDGAVAGDTALTPSCGGPGLACCPGNACDDGGCCMNGICMVAGSTCPTPGSGGTGGHGGTTATGGAAGVAGSAGGTMATVGTGGTAGGTGTGGMTGAAGMGGTAGAAGKGGTTNLATGGATGGKGGAAGSSGPAGGNTGGAGSTSTSVGGTGGAGSTATAVGGQGGATGGVGGGAGGTGAGCATCLAPDVCTGENTCVKPGTIDSFSTCDLAIDPLEGRLGQWDIRVGSAVTCEYPPCGGINHPEWAPAACAAWIAGSPAITEIPEIYSTIDVGLRPKDDPSGSLYDACKHNAVEITYDTSHRDLSVLMYAQWNGLAPYGQKSSVALEGSETPVTKIIKFSQFGLKCGFLAGFNFVPWAPRAGFRFSVYSLRFVTAH